MKSLLQNTLILVMLSTIISCKNDTQAISENDKEADKTEFVATMQKHLDAVSNKDLATLKSTLSPKGNMQLILPSSEITHTVEDFMLYHKEWFAVENGWTFETKILNTDVGETMGMAVTEIVYREPERDGKPYFNRMVVSYDLKKIDGKWYIIKDQASSIEKSTDE